MKYIFAILVLFNAFQLCSQSLQGLSNNYISRKSDLPLVANYINVLEIESDASLLPILLYYSSESNTPLSSATPLPKSEIIVYPNPTTQTLNFSDGFEGDITIYDILGRRIFQQKVNANNQTVDVSHIPEGTYLTILADSQKLFSQTTKLFKQ